MAQDVYEGELRSKKRAGNEEVERLRLFGDVRESKETNAMHRAGLGPEDLRQDNVRAIATWQVGRTTVPGIAWPPPSASSSDTVGTDEPQRRYQTFRPARGEAADQEQRTMTDDDGRRRATKMSEKCMLGDNAGVMPDQGSGAFEDFCCGKFAEEE